MVLLMFLATNHGAIGQLAGAWGEEQTRAVLKRAKRRKLIWGSVDGVATGTGDIDLFVITRQAGLVAIDSKWRNDVNRSRLEADASYATEAARRADQILRSMKVPVGVTPLVVMWGAVRSEVPGGANIRGVDFVSGDMLLEWLSAAGGEPVDAASARELEQRLVAFRERVRPSMP